MSREEPLQYKIEKLKEEIKNLIEVIESEDITSKLTLANILSDTELIESSLGVIKSIVILEPDAKENFKAIAESCKPFFSKSSKLAGIVSKMMRTVGEALVTRKNYEKKLKKLEIKPISENILLTVLAEEKEKIHPEDIPKDLWFKD